MTERQIKLADFEKPGLDITLAIAEAIEYVAQHQIDTIIFEPKTYLLQGQRTIWLWLAKSRHKSAGTIPLSILPVRSFAQVRPGGN